MYNGIKRSVSTSGCGATCLSMLIAYETGYTYQSPYTVFRDACQQGLYKGSGLSRSAMSQLAEQYALIGQWMDLNAQELLQTLKRASRSSPIWDRGCSPKGAITSCCEGLPRKAECW